MGSVTVSAKIPEELREKLRKHDVNISATFRKSLVEELKRIEKKKLEEKADRLSTELKGKVSTEDVVKAIRSTREAH